MKTTTQEAAIADDGDMKTKMIINPELWQVCAGPLVNLPPTGTHVMYFPQGHTEHVAASLNKHLDPNPNPNYPNLPSNLLCHLNNLTLHAHPQTHQLYAKFTLQPLPPTPTPTPTLSVSTIQFEKEALLRSDLGLNSNKPLPEYFCKQLTPSDTSSQGGFSIPRRAAVNIFPPLDYSMQPPAQEIVARDLHDNLWRFRHIYRGMFSTTMRLNHHKAYMLPFSSSSPSTQPGQPKRHLLTTGWSLFVTGNRLFAGDSVLFIRDEKQQLHLGIRRAEKQPANVSSSVLSSDSMHIGILAAAAHAAANNTPFTVFYNPRAGPSDFVIPLAKYYKAVYSHQISPGMRFRMMFETEDSGTRRYMGTITGISDLDPVRWKNSQWRNLQVGWDESSAGEKRSRVSVWEIEPVTSPFFICPPPFFRSKRPRQPGMPDDEPSYFDNLFKRTMPWLGDDMCIKDPQALPGLSLVQWMSMQQNPALASSLQQNYVPSFSGPVLQNLPGADIFCQLGYSAPQIFQSNNVAFNTQRLLQTAQQLDHLQKLPSTSSALGAVTQPQQQLGDITRQPRQNMANQTLPHCQVQAQLLHPQNLVQTNNILQQQQPSSQNHQLHRSLSQNQLQQQHQLQQTIMGQNQQQSLIQSPMTDHVPQLQMSDNQIQLLQKLRQQQSLLAQQAALQQPTQLTQIQDQQRQLLDAAHNFSRALTPGQVLDVPPVLQNVILETNSITHQITKANGWNNIQFSHLTQQPKLQQQQPRLQSEMSGHAALSSIPTTNQLSAAGSSILTGAAGVGQSVIADDVPSCSTSPSANNCVNALPPLINSLVHRSTTKGDDMAQSAATILSSSVLETMSSSANMVKDLQSKSEVKPPLNISKNQNQVNFGSQTYLNTGAAQTDYLDTSSSTASVCLSQSDAHMHHQHQNNTNPLSYSSQCMLFRDNNQDGEVQADARLNIPYGNSIDCQIGVPPNRDSILTKGTLGTGKYLSNNFSSGGMLGNYESSRDAQQELSSSMVSQTFGVPDMTFNSIDSTIDDSSFLDRGPWAPPAPPPPPQFQRMRTYTKVYKRGAVGRSIDITRYSGYEELKQDLSRRFGIEGQLEDRQRIGWKLVYVDHEKDVLLVGDDPWEEFVNCVRCIKILSPQEVQQISLDGDFGNGGLPNQACSSSDGGNT